MQESFNPQGAPQDAGNLAGTPVGGGVGVPQGQASSNVGQVSSTGHISHLPNPMSDPSAAASAQAQVSTPLQHQTYSSQQLTGQVTFGQPPVAEQVPTQQYVFGGQTGAQQSGFLQGSTEQAPQTQQGYAGQAGQTIPTQQQAAQSVYAGQAAYTQQAQVSYTQQPPHITQAPEPQKKTDKGTTFLVGLLGVLVGAALSVGSLYAATSGFSFSGQVDTSNIVIDATSDDIELPVAVAAKVTPSVVNIDVFATQRSFSLEDFFGGSNSGDREIQERTGLGSGVILTADGYILTNYHVIEGEGNVLIVSLDNEELEATVVGSDPSSDLAVLKVDAQGLTPIEIGDSDAVQVGEWVMAVGSPFGLEKSVSSGIVSALYRSTAMQSTSGPMIYANLIQTDAAINPGNSGGALVNRFGELIGINTLINSASGSSAGVGFAVPSNFAFAVAEKIINGEDVQHPYIGVTLYTVDAAVAQELALSVQSGAYIESVLPGSPAEQAGIEPGDVITSLDNRNINTSAELIIAIRGYSIGESVKLGINRGGQTQNLELILGATGS